MLYGGSVVPFLLVTGAPSGGTTTGMLGRGGMFACARPSGVLAATWAAPHRRRAATAARRILSSCSIVLMRQWPVLVAVYLAPGDVASSPDRELGRVPAAMGGASLRMSKRLVFLYACTFAPRRHFDTEHARRPIQFRREPGDHLIGRHGIVVRGAALCPQTLLATVMR